MKINPRILVVDDEPQIRRVLKISLTARGYDTRVASGGISAAEIFGDWLPDLVITDLSMPDMDGLELCRRLRAKSRIPIIVLSAGRNERAERDALDAGADDYIPKPFEINELYDRVQSLLLAERENENLTT